MTRIENGLSVTRSMPPRVVVYRTAGACTNRIDTNAALARGVFHITSDATDHPVFAPANGR